jgi:hypothetical protein
MKRRKAKFSITIENIQEFFFQLEEELELPKIWLKLENHEIILHKTDHNFVKNGICSILQVHLCL